MLRLRSAAFLALAPLTAALFAGPLATAADRASKPPKAIAAEAVRELAQARSFHLTGTQVDKNGRGRVSADVTASGPLDMKVVLPGLRLRFRLVGRATFIKANERFWLGMPAYDGPAPEELAGRWVRWREPVLRRSLRALRPVRQAQCLRAQLGTLEKAGTDVLDGRRVIVLASHADRPGTFPGRLYVTATGRALPLRLVQTGPSKRGRRSIRRCGDGGATLRADTRLSAFDEPVDIRAPASAIEISQR